MISETKKLMTEIKKAKEINFKDHFTKYLNELWGDVSNSNTRVALLLIDIDHFKRYNDFHGHIEGDHCLQKIGDCMRTVIENHGGMLGRFGG